MTAHVERTGEALQLCDEMGLLTERAYRSQRQWLKWLHRREQQIDVIEQRIHAAAKRHSPQQDLLIIHGRDRAAMLDDGCEYRPILPTLFCIGLFMGNRGLD